jgi:hypothetical protein
MQTVIRFNGHITWEGQSNGLPETIYAYLVSDGLDDDAILQLMENQLRQFVGSQMMSVQKDQGSLIDLRKTPQGRMAVPFHMIAYIDVDVIPMTGELPNPDEDGVERLEDGTEPVKQ